MTIKQTVDAAENIQVMNLIRLPYNQLADEMERKGELFIQASNLTRSNWRKAKWESKAIHALDQARRFRADYAWGQEARRDRREFRESLSEQGLQIFEVIDSYTFSTQPFPLEYARTCAYRDCEDLAKLGFKARTMGVDIVRRSTRCPYWGGTYDSSYGKYVVLIEGLPMDAELARRAHTAHLVALCGPLMADKQYREF